MHKKGLFQVKDMQTPLHLKKFFFILCPKWRVMFGNEWNVNFPIFFFLRYDRSKIEKLYPFGYKNKKRCAMFWKGFLSSWIFCMWCLFFEIWSNMYFTFVMHSGHRRIQKILYDGWGEGALRPLKPPPRLWWIFNFFFKLNYFVNFFFN